jgi:lipopolysaccharide transport protein LptA
MGALPSWVFSPVQIAEIIPLDQKHNHIISVSDGNGGKDETRQPAARWAARFGAVVLVLWTGANCSVSHAQSATPGPTPARESVSAKETVKRSGKAAKTTARHEQQTSAKSHKESGPVDSKPLDTGTPFGALATSNRGPISIQSDSLALDYKQNAVLFDGHVHANQADAQLTSNTLRVKYGKDDFHEVQDMVADGNVHISQGVRWCTSDHAVMDQRQHTVILTGSPICHDARDQIAGTRITVHLDTGRSDVEAAKAVIFPQQSKTRDNEAMADQAK